MLPPDTLNDGGFQTGSYDVTINGYSYTLDTVDHDLPVATADASNADGTPKGGAAVRMKERLSVKIKAVTGTPAPAAMVPFSLAIHGFSAKYWYVSNRKIASSNEGATIRTYTADIVEHVNTPAS